MTPHFFGYGSLVNRKTHDYPEARTATLPGWRRQWVASRLRTGPVYLTAVPDSTAQIDGLIAAVPNADWAALDKREAAYRRHVTPLHGNVSVYAIDATDVVPADGHFILLSYLDVVVQGYLREFGEAGVQHFFDTTTGWDLRVRNDRATPVYSRALEISAEETALVDKMLGQYHLG